MKTSRASAKNIDEYIAGFPPDVQDILEQVRATIRKAAPMAQEAIKYGIPTFVLGENLVHFGGFKEHVGFYPTPSAIEEFKEELASYESAKGSVQFPFARPMPYSLIRRMVKFRVNEVAAKASTKTKKKKA